MPPHTTIAAIATPPGFGGVGIVRISGPAVPNITATITGKILAPRRAELSNFLDNDASVIDQGIAILFVAPHSFTGEDVLELQGHGGPVVLDLLLQRVLALGCILARPGEFTERAYLGGKLDLAQAEAVADLITSSTAAAARASVRTLQGTFSQHIHALSDALLALRTHVEAALDFPDEQIDWLANDLLLERLDGIINTHTQLLRSAHQGQLLRDGLTLVIAGAPNAGKSSLLNALAGKDTAIVTPIPGTTRDLLREHIHIDGMPLHIIDTAGLRTEACDPIEQEGMRRAREAIQQADRVLWVIDDREDLQPQAVLQAHFPPQIPITVVRNKIDLTGTAPGPCASYQEQTAIAISALKGLGLDTLRQHLKTCSGYLGLGTQEGEFMARRRHLHSLEHTATHLQAARQHLGAEFIAELFAEELRQAHNGLGHITGEVCPEALLEIIFSQFCIGK